MPNNKNDTNSKMDYGNKSPRPQKSSGKHNKTGEKSTKQDNSIEKVKEEVQEVVNAMEETMRKVAARGHRLSELDRRAIILEFNAQMFKTQAHIVKKKYWWQNLKAKITIGVISTVIVILIIVWIVSMTT